MNTSLNTSLPTHRAAQQSVVRRSWPTEPISWLQTGREGLSKKLLGKPILAQTLAQIEAHGGWSWPERPVCFVSDLHADVGALWDSLACAGYVSRQNETCKVNESLRQVDLVVGGDCLDKGPSNFHLLEGLSQLRHQGVQPIIIAGNHDVRLLMGLRAPQSTLDSDSHFFVRMMPKVLPLFIEALALPEANEISDSHLPSEAECQTLLMPKANWAEAFRACTSQFMSEVAIEKECKRTRKKVQELPGLLQAHALSFKQLYKAYLICKSLFLKEQGRFAWFFQDMKLVDKRGSFLFVHAGLCNEVVSLLRTEGLQSMNERFTKGLYQDNMSAFYFGPLFNTVRTKYRETDYQLDKSFTEQLFQSGIHAVVHGHRNRLKGQRLAMRRGMIHFEADVTLDRNSRQSEGLPGVGAGVLLIQPFGKVQGFSVDYHAYKEFEPANWGSSAKVVHE